MTFHVNPATIRTVADSIRDLKDMLAYKRRAGSRAERLFIRRFLLPLGVRLDKAGNLLKTVGDNPHGIAWSCHTDSVHREGGRQKLAWRDAELIVDPLSKSNCLGADDAAGVWLCRELILAGIPGLYLFHRGEESGGKGSSWLAKNRPQVLQGIRAVIALDRRGTTDVITRQAGGRCASDAFADSLAAQLGGAYRKCPYGVFTDSANYTGLVGECTNLSVGYAHEHTPNESLDVPHLVGLRDKLVRLDQSALVIQRKPGEKEPFHDPDFSWKDWNWRKPRGAPYGESRGEVVEWRPRNRYGWNAHGWSRDGRHESWADCYDADDSLDWHGDLRKMTVLDLVKEYPAEVADVIESYGLDSVSLYQEIAARKV